MKAGMLFPKASELDGRKQYVLLSQSLAGVLKPGFQQMPKFQAGFKDQKGKEYAWECLDVQRGMLRRSFSTVFTKSAGFT